MSHRPSHNQNLDPLRSALRAEARTLPASGILEVFNYGLGRPGLIPLWAGEGDEPTPAFICEAASQAMARGETFYTNNRGTRPLREALVAYHERLYGVPAAIDEFIVTCGGMSAIQLAVQATVPPGAEIVIPAPAWPNFAGAIGVHGATLREVPLTFDRAGWHLDVDRLLAAVTDRTRAIIVNSPANPTGWVASAAELAAILDFARRRGIWIIADEIYGRFIYDGALAPSFQTIKRADDRLIFVNTFSKNWAMTGWRMGWLQASPALAQVFENLVQYNTSGVPTFQQSAGVTALRDGEAFVASQIARAKAGRAVVSRALDGLAGITYAPPAGAFYAFFRLDGTHDSMAAAFDLVDKALIGPAPGIAFGPAGEGFLRICFLRRADQLAEAMDRFVRWRSAS